jgi:hypothetical protein
MTEAAARLGSAIRGEKGSGSTTKAFENVYGKGSATVVNMSKVLQNVNRMLTALRDDGAKGYTIVPRSQQWFIAHGKGDHTAAVGEFDGKRIAVNVDKAFGKIYYPLSWTLGHESAHNVGIRGDTYIWHDNYRQLTTAAALNNADSYMDFVHR